jgi:type I restriction enzyme R subunit
MPKLTSEANFESALEAHLLAPENPSRYLPARPEDYDRDLCLIPATVQGFLRASQPEKWKSLRELLGEDADGRVLKRIRTVIEKKGTLHILRKGFDESGHHFDLCYFQPTSGLNPALQKLYQSNVLQVMRQWKFSKFTEESIDTGIFLNGLPLFTAELKNPLSGQNVAHAIAQYRARDPKEGLFGFGRVLAHFAVDPEQVWFATTLAGKKTDFVPFNQGYDGGAGNPPSATGFSTAYLWQDIWSRPSLLDLLQRFLQVMPVLDDKGRDTGKKRQIFPRYHQLTTVREVTGHARQCGAGHSYLNQHSAGSGKTLEIATLANGLATLHTAQDKPVFSSVIVVSDRRVIDRQLQRTLLAFTSEKAMVEVIDEGKTSRDLKAALLDGKKIIVSTIQKFPRILEDLEKLGKLPGNSFAVIIDEAHSSQAGDAAEAVNRVFSYAALEKTGDEKDEETWEDRVVELMKRRGRMKHVSFFAFTATPKPETLELFRTKMPDGKWRVPFTLYTMRQAIEEGFILDVLKNYTTYDQYFNLLKKIAEDPQYDRKKATTLLKQFVGLHKHTVAKKARIMVDHIRDKVQSGIEGKAKAMIVTRSRLHAVRYALAVRAYLKELGQPFKAMVAFTGIVKDPDTKEEYTETGMNGVSDTKTEQEFEADDNKLLIVANKFQTGFDQPLLAAMYVDRKLKGVTAVQTLSRLNRTRHWQEGDVRSRFRERPGRDPKGVPGLLRPGVTH